MFVQHADKQHLIAICPNQSAVTTLMPFPTEEHQALLNVKGVGPTVVQRLEQIGINSLQELAESSVSDIVTAVAGQLGSTCWKNSPQARAAIQAAIDLAKSRQ